MAKTLCVDPAKVDLIWPEIAHWIKRAYEYRSDSTYEETEQDVLTGRALLWVGLDGRDIIAAAVTKIWKTTPR
ncbi:MAG: hypothetical protein ACM3IH_14140, partial [Sphingobacteriales bacterium]